MQRDWAGKRGRNYMRGERLGAVILVPPDFIVTTHGNDNVHIAVTIEIDSENVVRVFGRRVDCVARERPGRRAA